MYVRRLRILTVLAVACGWLVLGADMTARAGDPIEMMMQLPARHGSQRL
jgi:hypothetical protein